MKFLPLIFANLGRKKLRTIFTLLSVFVAFVLYGYLTAVAKAFDMGIDVSGVDRLIVLNKVAIVFPLPKSYMDKIARLPGVADVTHASWFGGNYQDKQVQFMQAPVDPDGFFRMYPEMVVPPEQMKVWKETKTGAVIGSSLAKQYGWKLGDRVPIQATIYPKRDGSRIWEFDIVGIYTAAKRGVDTTGFFFRRDYFEDSVSERASGAMGWYYIRVADPKQSATVCKAVDEMFANSPAETTTSTEKAFMQAFAKQVGDVGAIIASVTTAVFFTILLVAANTMAQSVRERLGELAVLKTLGFTGPKLFGLILAESLALSLVAGGSGIALAYGLIEAFGDPTAGALPIFYFPAAGVVRGLLIVVGLGVVAGVVPAIQAMRLRIVDALRAA